MLLSLSDKYNLAAKTVPNNLCNPNDPRDKNCDWAPFNNPNSQLCGACNYPQRVNPQCIVPPVSSINLINPINATLLRIIVNIHAHELKPMKSVQFWRGPVLPLVMKCSIQIPFIMRVFRLAFLTPSGDCVPKWGLFAYFQFFSKLRNTAQILSCCKKYPELRVFRIAVEILVVNQFAIFLTLMPWSVIVPMLTV